MVAEKDGKKERNEEGMVELFKKRRTCEMGRQDWCCQLECYSTVDISRTQQCSTLLERISVVCNVREIEGVVMAEKDRKEEEMVEMFKKGRT